MGIWDSIKKYGPYALGGVPGLLLGQGQDDLLTGTDPEEYKPYDPNATSVGDAFGVVPYAQGQMQGAQGRQAAQAGSAVTGQASQLSNEQAQFRQQQLGLADLLGGAARGQGPSAASMAADRAREEQLAQSVAMQAGRRGASAVTGARQAQRSIVQGNQGIAQQEAIGRQQEMLAARGQLGDVLAGGRAGDINYAGQNAQLAQGMTLANMDARNRRAEFNAGLTADQMRANDQYALGLGGLLGDLSTAELQARMQREQLAAGQLSQGTPGILGPLLGAGGQIAGAAIMASDVNSKSGARKWTKAERQQYLGEQILGGLTSLAGGYFAGKARKKDEAEEQLKKAEEEKRFFRQYELIHGKPHPESPEGMRLAEEERKKAEQEKREADEAYRREFSDSVNGPLFAPESYSVYSDEDSKSEKREARRMLDELTPFTYEYKDDAKAAGMPSGRQAGVMHQDLMKTKAGRKMDAGRDPSTGYAMVDYLKGLPTMMAGLADINDRLAKLEKKKGR